MFDPLSDLWSLKCDCNAIIEITGNNIRNTSNITCQNCGKTADITGLKSAVDSLESFITSINNVLYQKEKDNYYWNEITIPGFNEPFKRSPFGHLDFT